MDEPGLQLLIDEHQDLVRVSLDGRVDSANVQAFRSHLLPYAERDGIRMLIDGTKLDYLNSHSLGILTRLHRSCCAHGGRMVLYGLAPRLENIFALIGLDRLLHHCATEKEARALLDGFTPHAP